ncbi:MAG: methyltransferase domain-containing protein [Vicinamibacterales bacterium]
MLRSVRPELLDELPADDPHAIRSRRDLKTVNTLMGTADIMARALLQRPRRRPPETLVELGAGDGTLLLEIARRVAPNWNGLRAVLVDQQSLVTAQTRAQFKALSWHIESVQADVLQWLRERPPQIVDVTVANLFLHHFGARDLGVLLGEVSRQTRTFLACEPRRSRPALAAAAMLGVVGCNRVTVHDATISVRAGFRAHELSAIWPRAADWMLTEGDAGRFSHIFQAEHASRV